MHPHSVDSFYNVLRNPIFLAAFFSWFIAQLLKATIDAVRHRSRTSREVVTTLFWATGGMPSSHSALVTALATAIGFEHGFSSPMFSLALFYGLLVIRDALGVRRATGTQAQAINRMGRKLQERFEVEFEPVQEVLGHTPAEVSVGALLGFFIAVAFSLL